MIYGVSSLPLCKCVVNVQKLNLNVTYLKYESTRQSKKLSET